MIRVLYSACQSNFPQKLLVNVYMFIFIKVIDSKNAFGIERAYGAIFFSSGGFATKEDYHIFARNQAIANSSLNSAIEYSVVVRGMHQIYVEEVIIIRRALVFFS